jgi:hypothetical protein
VKKVIQVIESDDDDNNNNNNDDDDDDDDGDDDTICFQAADTVKTTSGSLTTYLLELTASECNM